VVTQYLDHANLSTTLQFYDQVTTEDRKKAVVENQGHLLKNDTRLTSAAGQVKIKQNAADRSNRQYKDLK